ncbi:MAG: tRNA (adenosine(37)-N6)-threonylcarbamoyltransferase complex transferase subunit TsaD, partial [Candidatus Yanofskybacteria bacterium]|nr:tRNA (adenosine(37)-N6)-threonylcarbamoyltransferase complex transferase subunit TsaD [Candidatus Yanofskybacteria bacterium]
SGGVSANKLLRKRLAETAQDLGIKYFCPPLKYTTDNAAMIAVAGYFAYKKQPEKFEDWQTVVMQPNLSL